jgi:hypothetical protein
MPESGTYGSVRGALSNERPYRDCGLLAMTWEARLRGAAEPGNNPAIRQYGVSA